MIDMRRRSMMISAKPESRLPEGYTEVQYLESDGQAWFYFSADGLGAQFAANDHVELEALRLSGTADAAILGAYTGSTGELYFSGGKLMRWNTFALITPAANTPVALNTSVDIIVNLTGSIYYNLQLFGYRGGTYPLHGRIAYCRVLRDGAAIVDLVPCVRMSDNTAGMYDVVNDVFYPSEGTSSFVAGPAV